MICLICGMKITDKIYNLNNSSFIDKNTIENIKYCPFCGVEKDYIKDEKEILNVSNLDNNTKKILDHAMKLEVFNGEFYKQASTLAKSEEYKKMFKDLSNIEFMHAKVHKRLGGFDKLPILRKIDYSRLDSDLLLLEEANKREKHAILFYQKYIKETDNQTIKNIFNALSDVEKQHIILTAI